MQIILPVKEDLKASMAETAASPSPTTTKTLGSAVTFSRIGLL